MMWETTSELLNESAFRATQQVIAFLPRLAVLFLILLTSILLAWLTRMVLLRLFRGIDLDERAQRFGFSQYFAWSASQSPAMVLATAAQWLILLLGLLLAVAAIDAAVASQVAVGIFRFLPNLLIATLILVVGHLFAQFVSQSVLISAVNMHIHSARLLSLGVKWLVLVLAAAMALEHLGIGRQIVVLAFGILFGGIVLALALALGLGSKEMISRSWERQLREPEEEKEEFRHL